MLNYCDRYGSTIEGVSKTFGPVPHWGGAQAEEVHRQLIDMVPLDKLQVGLPIALGLTLITFVMRRISVQFGKQVHDPSASY